MFVADDLFLMAHDRLSGKLRLPESSLGIGLSSGLLAELMFSGCVIVAQSQLLLGEHPPPDDQLAQALFDRVRGQLLAPQTTLTLLEWISSRRYHATELVADRLIRRQVVVRHQHRRLGRLVTRYRAVSPADVFMREQRLSTFLRNRMELTELDVVVAALAMLVSIGDDLMELGPEGRDHLERLFPQLPVPLRELLAATDSAVSASLRGTRP
jgi:hypothetical protein